MKVLICTPAYNSSVTTGYLSSVINVILQAPARGHEVNLFTNSDSLVTRARNNAVAVFLDGDWDRLFWIDADISFTPDQFFRVLEAGRDITAAGYPLKRLFLPDSPTTLTGRDLEAAMLRYAVTLEGDVTMPGDGFVQVVEAATGFMCISRRVFDALVEGYPELKYTSDQEGLGAPTSPNHYLFFDTMVENGRYLSEDYAFCRRAQRIDIPVWLDLQSELTHTGSFDFKGSIPDTIRASQMQ